MATRGGAIRNGLIRAFPPLEKDLRCDVLVVGGGITGSLIADELSRHGHDVALIEQRDIGWGSTAASTALLQYEIDTHLLELAQRYGNDAAALAYRACADAIPALGEVARGLKDVDFRQMDSLYLASRRRGRAALDGRRCCAPRHWTGRPLAGPRSPSRTLRRGRRWRPADPPGGRVDPTALPTACSNGCAGAVAMCTTARCCTRSSPARKA